MKSFPLAALLALATMTACAPQQTDSQQKMGAGGAQKMRAGGTCCLPAGSTAAYTYCIPGGDKCCTAVGAASCVGIGGVVISPPSACDTAPPTC